MRALIYSDTHGKDIQIPPKSNFDIVILAGDIGTHTHGLIWARKNFDCPIFYVAGNHEFYDSHLHRQSIELQKVAEALNINFLDNSTSVLGGIKFIGATLWTDFRLFGNSLQNIGDCLHAAKNGLADFSLIRFGSTGWMTPADSVKLFNVSYSVILDELNKNDGLKKVVITHHLPSMLSVHDKFKKDILTACFASNLDHIVKLSDFWIHGHTHDSCDYYIDKCRVLCNPRGYLLEGGKFENEKFNNTFIIDLS